MEQTEEEKRRDPEMNNKKNDWKTFFDSHAREYQWEPWTSGTTGEVDFLIREMGLVKGMCILDVSCGTGRHSIKLARRGYAFTGIDITEFMLAETLKAGKKWLDIRFMQADTTEISLNDTFDVAICLCEGAFGLSVIRCYQVDAAVSNWEAGFDVVIMAGNVLIYIESDMEYMDAQKTFIRNAATSLRTGGHLYMDFELHYNPAAFFNRLGESSYFS